MFAKISCRLLLVLSLLLWFPSLTFGQGANPGQAAYKAAEGMRKQKQYAAALPKYEEAISKEPQNAKYYYGKAQCLVKMNNLDEAINALNKATSIKESYASAYALLAKIYAKKKDNPRAEQYFGLAFKHEQDASKRINYKLNQVQLLIKMERLQEAKSNLEQAKAISPEDARVLYAEGDIYAGMKNWAAAKSAYEKALDKVKDTPSMASKYYYGLAVAQFNNNESDAAEKTASNITDPKYLKKWKSVKTKSGHMYFYRLASAYYKVSEDEEAINQVNKALQINSSFSSGYALLGKIYYKKGQPSQAISNFNKAVEAETKPETKQKLYNQMVKIQLNSGDYNGALNSANKILANPNQTNNVSVLFMKAQAEYKLGQYSAAVQTCEKLLNIVSTDPVKKAPYNFLLGLAAAKMGDKTKASKAFKEAQQGSFKSAAKIELDKIAAK